VLGLALVGAAVQLGAGRRGRATALAAAPAASAAGPRPLPSPAATATRDETAETPAAETAASDDRESHTIATAPRRWQRRADRRPTGPPALFRNPGF
jgi:hypothetical protein